MDQFDDSIFSDNHLSFGHLIARDEEMAIWARKPSSIRLKTYQREASTIHAVAERLFEHIHVRQKWGKVGNHGNWVTVEAGQWYENARFKHRGKSLSLLDICKMLVGKTSAIGNTDVPTLLNWNRESGWEYNLITCLRLDVDMERSWRRHDLNAITQQIRTERDIAWSLGLPYNCFRTGGKGHQIVIPLPIPTSHLLAWWWLTAFRTLLESQRHSDATLDKDNLTSLMRLPGGIHQNQARLALWIDPDTMCLYDLPTQAMMMGDGFCYPQDDLAFIPASEFHVAGKQLLATMAATGYDKHHVPGMDQDSLFFDAIEAAPDNLAVRTFLHATEMAAQRNSDCDDMESADGACIDIVDISASSRTPNTDQRCDLSWAQRVVEEGFLPGGFWHWLNMDGQRGILALWLVHRHNAESEAIAMAQRIPCRSETERRKCIRTIKSYWRKCQFKDASVFVYITGSIASDRSYGQAETTGTLTSDGIDLVATLGEALQTTAKVQARNLEALLQAIHVIVLAMENSTNGHIQISAQILADSICQQWPETSVTRKDADRMLSWLTLDDDAKYPEGETPSKNKPSCKLALLQLVRDEFRDKYGTKIVANEYRLGPVLDETSLGKDLKARRRDFRRQFLCEAHPDQ